MNLGLVDRGLPQGLGTDKPSGGKSYAARTHRGKRGLAPDRELRSAVQAVAAKSKVTVLAMSAGTPQEIDLSYARMSRERASAAIILPDGYYYQQVRQLAGLAIRYRIPSIWGGRQYPDAGGLMSYGFSAVDNYRRAAKIVDKILKGAKPGDLPIEQSMRFELVINRTVARALGLKIPSELLLRADEVID